MDNVPISPTATFGQNVRIGRNVIIEDHVWIGDNVLIDHNTIIRPGVFIGDNSEIRPNCFIAEAARIGSRVKIFQFSNISKGAVIADRVYIGARVTFTNTRKISHERDFDPVLAAPIVEYGVRIGSVVTILPGITIGKNALIGACALVTRDVGENDIMMGVPAKRVGEVPIEERI
jgi:acetyltransferase-like isoleucine patch superfamily enzyme